MKKLILILVTLFLPILVRAYDAQIDGIYYVFNTTEKTASVTNLDFASSTETYTGDVTIPSEVTYNNELYSVTSIDQCAFWYCSELTSVTIPNSVLSISSDAFTGCSGLKTVTIPQSVLNISDLAFQNCSGLTSVNIHCSPTKIGSNVFIGCDNLKEAVFDSETITPIFAGFSSLEKVIIKDNSTSIGKNAFYGCKGITSVTISDNVKSIEEKAFYGCCGLTSLALSNRLISIGKYAFAECTSLQSVTIPNSVTSIGEGAFHSCSGLTSLTIGSGVTSIGSDAFITINLKKTIWLTNTPPTGYANVHSTINYVSNDQFKSLSNMIIYPFLSSMFEVDGIKYVPVSPSERTCDAIDCVYNETITNTTIASTVSYKGVVMTVKSMRPYFAYNNNYIESLRVDYKGVIADNSFQNCTNIKTLNIGEEVTSIGSQAFFNCSSLESIIIPDAVTKIGTNVFSGCTMMLSAKIGNGLTAIEVATFSGCSSLNEIIIGSQVKEINNSAFHDCMALPTITIPKNVIKIDNYVFEGCKNLRYFIVADREEELALGSNYNNPLFTFCPLDSVFIGGKITYYKNSKNGYSPFYHNESLRAIHITDKETIITENEFNGCTNLKNVIIGNGIQTIEDGAFSDCISLPSIKIPETVTCIGANAFARCKALPMIIIPKAVKTIDNNAFLGCEALKTVVIADREEELQLGYNISGKTTTPLFSSCPLDSVYIGGNINYQTESSYGYSPFYHNTSLRAIQITDKETEISENEFYGCTNLKNVRIGDGVKSIGNWAFSGCSSLDYFAFGYSMESIGKEAFSDCTNVTKIISRALIPPTCGSQALDDINKWNCTLTVPKNWLANYQVADQWKEFFFIIESEDIVMFIGDANSDGTVNVMDIVDIVSHTMGKPTSTGKFNEKAADANGDGMINAADVVKLVNIISGQ